jgi:hypothetical protein
LQETRPVQLTAKQQQFNAAMERYTGLRRYRLFGAAVSVANISLQLLLLWRLWPHANGVAWQLAALVVAWPLADFINGLVHLFMDGNDRYDSLAGPLVANFHLHHKTPRYARSNLAVVYFTETGSKVWLVAYLLVVLLLTFLPAVHPALLSLLVYVGILSSVAELSHYLCHSSTDPLAEFLARCGLLLSKRHHGHHHLQDNRNYAFLNGMTDPLLNLIAGACCRGYKQTTDLHYAHYVTPQNERL